jgi:(S)-sulfolactate dehydrogenase
MVISEFMDKAIVRAAFAGRDVLYDPALVDRPADLAAAVADARALVVRNRTQVRDALLAAAPRLRVVGRLGGAALDVLT